MANPLSSELHGLLVRPQNGSLVLGAAHHGLYRPANAAVKAMTGRELPKALDPAEWGAAAARAGEKVDRHLALPGVTRKETLTLDNGHLREIGAHLDRLGGDHGRALERDLDAVVADHYNKGETIRGLVGKAHADQNFRATLHDVPVPSVTGEVGRSVNNVAVGASTLYGASAITHQLQDALSPQAKEKQSSMSKLDAAIAKIDHAAQILDHLPVREAAYAKAASLADAGTIAAEEIEKFAGIFERNPSDADDIIASMRRGEEEGASKLASFGEVVKTEAAQTGGSSRGNFEALCLESAKPMPYR